MKKFWFIPFFIILFSNCSINHLVIGKTAGMIQNGMPALYEETDLQLAEASIASNLKLMEVLLKNDPGNKELKMLLAQAYSAYAMAYVEDETPQRASNFYMRARNYAFEVLNTNKNFRTGLKGSVDEFKAELKKLDKSWIEPLFWGATNWGNWVMLNLDNPRALFALAKINVMMERILELDESFYFAGAHLYFGSILAAKPVILGGKPTEAKMHFKRALELTDHKFLMTYVYYARFYAVQVQDAKLYHTLLQKVLDADINILPEFRLVNQIAKQKAKRWLNKQDDLF